MATMSMLEHRPDLIKLFLDVVTMLGSVIATLSAENDELKARGADRASTPLLPRMQMWT